MPPRKSSAWFRRRIEACSCRTPPCPYRDGYAFRRRLDQDPVGKSGVGNMVASLIDEGAGDLDSKTFHGAPDRRAIELGSLGPGLFPRVAAHASRTTRTRPSSCCIWR